MPKTKVKKTILGLAGVLAALGFGWSLSGFIAAPELGSLAIAFAAAAVFLSVFLLQTILGEDGFLSPFFIVAETAAMGAFFLGGFSIIFLAALLLAAGFLFSAHYSGASEIRNNLDIHFFKTARLIAAFAATALAIFSSLIYVNSFDLENPAASKKTLEAAIRPMEPLAAGYIPGFSSQNTVRDIAAALLPPEFKLVSEEERARAISQTADRLAESFSNFAGAPVRASDTVTDIAYNATIGKVAAQTPAKQVVWMAGFGVIVFFLVKFVLVFAGWAGALIGYGLYSILKISQFFTVGIQEIPKRVIILE